MKFFIDTANVEDIKKANDMGVICGVTTNPSLIAKEGRDFGEVIREIASIVDGPISGEVKATTEDAAGMIAEGAFRRGHQVQCDADLQREPGASGCARGRGVRQPVLGPSGRHQHAGH